MATFKRRQKLLKPILASQTLQDYVASNISLSQIENDKNYTTKEDVEEYTTSPNYQKFMTHVIANSLSETDPAFASASGNFVLAGNYTSLIKTYSDNMTLEVKPNDYVKWTPDNTHTANGLPIVTLSANLNDDWRLDDPSEVKSARMHIVLDGSKKVQFIKLVNITTNKKLEAGNTYECFITTTMNSKKLSLTVLNEWENASI